MLCDIEQGTLGKNNWYVSTVSVGATASDNVDSVLTATISGRVDTTKAGEYHVYYEAVDAAGNKGQAIRTVIVSPKIKVWRRWKHVMVITFVWKLHHFFKKAQEYKRDRIKF